MCVYEYMLHVFHRFWCFHFHSVKMFSTFPCYFFDLCATCKYFFNFQIFGDFWDIYFLLMVPSLMQIPACGIHVLWQQWTNSHGLQTSCGEKGTAWLLSKWERARGPESDPCLDRLLLLFWAHYIWVWSSFTMHGFAVGDYLLQITRESC